MRRATYPIELHSLREDGTGGWVARVPELPQCAAAGATAEDAVRNIQVKISEWAQRPNYSLNRNSG